MVRRRLEIVVMAVGRRPRQVREFMLVRSAVRAVMLDRQVQSRSQRKGAWRQPSQQDGACDEALESGAHGRHCVRGATVGQQTVVAQVVAQ